MKKYDCIVVGGGHAGIEAASSAARMGCRVIMLTMSLDTIGAMSCNPAIGGIGKGQLVKEMDAMGAVMAKAADACGIQFRILNSSKGPAVRSSRAQQDMSRYAAFMRSVVENTPNLEVRQAEVVDVLTDRAVVTGVRTISGECFFATTVVITAGTFLKGLMHIGMKHFSGGRLGEKESGGLSDSLRDLGLTLGRFKTGTPPRLDARTIAYDSLVPQPGDCPPVPFSFSTQNITLPQVPCHITYTNEKTHDIIRASLDQSPLYTGKIKSTGVRYCPSIEDKIVRFSERNRHQVFLEPQGLQTHAVYPNGISTSLPLDVQLKMVRSIKGLENARIIRPGYGIEYDYVEPTQLYPTLETKLCANLFLAGQVNGTTGYEEAAALGLMAGINAALKVKQKKPFVLGRHQAYIGVLIDDLTTKGTSEPYRMFTSRVEYRLVLREDNADLRLRSFGVEFGLLTGDDYDILSKKKSHIVLGLEYLKKTRLKPCEVNEKLKSLNSAEVDRTVSLEELLKRPQVRFCDLYDFDHLRQNLDFLTTDVIHQIEIEVKYAGFIRRQQEEITRFSKVERIHIPPELKFCDVKGLSSEIVEKLGKFKPVSLGQACRISGVTPAAISLLMVYINKLQKEKEKNEQKSEV
ncbi:MAG: tRNA uridine-5-carboxymethylaminomethyl(34) synthesis enzyme MnmG [Candidatus Omnitrophota bacterium]